MIYPSGHPSVRGSVQPLLETATALFTHTGEVTLYFGRERVAVALDAEDAVEESIPWLAARVCERGVAAIRFESEPDERTALALVGWLTQPVGDPPAPLPVIEGLTLIAADYTKIRFVEEAPGASATEDEMVWRRLVAGLHAGGVVGDPVRLGQASAADESAELARQIAGYLSTHEGTGIGSVVPLLVSASDSAEALPDAARALVQARLAELVAQLPDSLRAQLLRVTPAMSESRLRFLTTIVHRLPSATLLEVMRSMQLDPRRGSTSLVSFLVNLGGSAAAHGGGHAEAFSRALTSTGLPEVALDRGADVLRAALETMLVQPLDDNSVSHAYREQLDALSTLAPAPAMAIDETHFTRADVPEQVVRHAAHVAVNLLLADPFAADNATLLRRALSGLPAALVAGDTLFLARLADATRPEPPVSDASWAAAVEEVRRQVSDPAMVTRLLEALDGASTAKATQIGHVLRLGGIAVAETLLDRVGSAPSTERRDLLVDALASFEIPVLKQLLFTARAQLRVHPGVLVAVLCHQSVAVAQDLAEPFITDADADVRLQAYRVVLNSGPNVSKLDRLVHAALEDPDPRIVELAVAELRSKAPAHSARPLGRLLGHRTTPVIERAQHLAVQVLLDAGAPLGRDHLMAALGGRTRFFNQSSRTLSLAIGRALQRLGGAAASREVARWRRSPAGLLSLILRDRAV